MLEQGAPLRHKHLKMTRQGDVSSAFHNQTTSANVGCNCFPRSNAGRITGWATLPHLLGPSLKIKGSARPEEQAAFRSALLLRRGALVQGQRRQLPRSEMPQGRSHPPRPALKRALVTSSGRRAGGRGESPQGPAAGTSSLHTRPPPGCSLPPRTSRLKLEPELFLCASVRALGPCPALLGDRREETVKR